MTKRTVAEISWLQGVDEIIEDLGYEKLYIFIFII